MIGGCISHNEIILASKSPRRRQLLEQFGLQIKIVPSKIDEKQIPETEPSKYVQLLATAKARYVAEAIPNAWIIGADTIVVLENHILGKPLGPAQARSMLQKLSGNTHTVFTAIAVGCKNRQDWTVKVVATQVTFKTLSRPEIQWYVSTGEPFDKAGGYGIQGMGAFMVRSISGSYSNVVGLPLCETIEILIAKEAIMLSDARPEGV